VTGTTAADVIIQSILGLAVKSKKIVAALESNLHRITSQIRGTLSLKRYANPELNQSLLGSLLCKCVETRWFASLWDGGIVRTFGKPESNFAQSAL